MSSVLCINKQDLINKIAVRRALEYTEGLNIAYEILTASSSSNSVFNGSTGATFILDDPLLFELMNIPTSSVDTSDVVAGSGYMQLVNYVIAMGAGSFDLYVNNGAAAFTYNDPNITTQDVPVTETINGITETTGQTEEFTSAGITSSPYVPISILDLRSIGNKSTTQPVMSSSKATYDYSGLSAITSVNTNYNYSNSEVNLNNYIYFPWLLTYTSGSSSNPLDNLIVSSNLTTSLKTTNYQGLILQDSAEGQLQIGILSVVLVTSPEINYNGPFSNNSDGIGLQYWPNSLNNGAISDASEYYLNSGDTSINGNQVTTPIIVCSDFYKNNVSSNEWNNAIIKYVMKTYSNAPL